MDGNAARTKRWRRLEYERLVDLGAFPPGDRLELVAGELLVHEPQGSPHATAIRSAQEALRAALSLGPKEHIAPLAVPSARILVADLLP